MKAASLAKGTTPAGKQPRRAKPLPKVFTVRDLNRDTAAVLNAVRQHGRVVVRSRGGEEYALSRITTAKATSGALRSAEEFAERHLRYREQMRALDAATPSSVDVERLNRIIAGEE